MSYIIKCKLLHIQFELTSRKAAEPDKLCYYIINVKMCWMSRNQIFQLAFNYDNINNNNI